MKRMIEPLRPGGRAEVRELEANSGAGRARIGPGHSGWPDAV